MALLETLTDDFSTGTLDTTKWTTANTNTATATVSGGVLNLNTNGTGNGVVCSVDSYTFGPSSQVSAKVFRDPATVYVTKFVVSNQASGTLGGNSQFQLYNGLLYCYAYDYNSVAVSTSFTYNPVTHAWLRMRFSIFNSDVTTRFDTSPDGITWTQQYSATRTWPSNACYVRLSAERNGVTTPRISTFAYVNAPPPLLETLTDTFDGPTLDTTKWTADNTGAGSATVSGGVLRCSTGGNSTGAVNSAIPYSFGPLSQITGKVVIDPAAGNAFQSQFLVSNTSGGSTAGGQSLVHTTNGLMYFFAYDSVSNNSNTSILYSAALTWVRMRFDVSGTNITTYFDTSPDGLTWTQRYTATKTWTSNKCYARLAANGNGETTSRTTTFDNINVAPATVPAVPSTPAAIQPTGTSRLVRLSWSSVSGATSYIVYRGGSSVGSTGALTLDDIPPADGAYSYTVAASNTAGTSGPSPGVAVTVDRTATRMAQLA